MTLPQFIRRLTRIWYLKAQAIRYLDDGTWRVLEEEAIQCAVEMERTTGWKLEEYHGNDH